MCVCMCVCVRVRALQADAGPERFLKQFLLFSAPIQWDVIMTVLACPPGTTSFIEQDAASNVLKAWHAVFSAVAF